MHLWSLVKSKIVSLRDLETFWSLDDAMKMISVCDFYSDIEKEYIEESKKRMKKK